MRIKCTPYSKLLVMLTLFSAFSMTLRADRHFFIDVNSQSPTENGTGANPWKSFESAQTGLRSHIATQSEDFIVNVRTGTYVIDTALVYTDEDSGVGDYTVTYQPHGAASVLITGAEEVTGTWVDEGSNIWSLAGQTAEYHVVFVDGTVRYKARYPNWDPANREINYMQVDSYVTNTKFSHAAADEAMFDGLDSAATDLEVVAWHSTNKSGGTISQNYKWWPYLFDINSVDDVSNEVTCSDFGTTSLRSEADYYIQGDKSLLDAEGEYYLDTAADKLYLYSTTNPGSREVRVPTNSTNALFQFTGTSTDLVRNIVFEGFEVAYTDRGVVPFHVSGYAEKITISGCRIHDASAAAVRITGESRYCSILDNVIHDSGGMLIVGLDATVAGEIPNGYHSVRNNQVSGIGWLIPDQDIRGLNINNSGANVVSHNRMDNTIGSAIRVSGKGWRANYSSLQNGIDWSPARDNVVKFNDLSNFSETCQDLGGININAINEGTLLENNIVRDKTPRKLGTTVWNRSHSLGIYSARDNMGSTVRNNIIHDMVSNADGPIPYVVRVAGNKPILENNIIADNVVDRSSSEEAVLQVRSPLEGELANNVLSGNTLMNSNPVTYLAVTSWEKELDGTNDDWDGSGAEIMSSEFNYSDDPLSISSNYSGLNSSYSNRAAWFSATGLEEFSSENQQSDFMDPSAKDYRPRYDSSIWRLSEFESIDVQNIGLEANHPYSPNNPVIGRAYLKEQNALNDISWVETLPNGSKTLVAMARDEDGFVIDPSDYYSGPSYSSNNASVATVNSTTGEVTAVGYGVAEIAVDIATSASHSKSSSMHAVVQKLEIDSAPLQIFAGSNASVTVDYNLQGVTPDRNIQCRIIHKSTGVLYGSEWKVVSDDTTTSNDETVSFSVPVDSSAPAGDYRVRVWMVKPGGSWSDRIGFKDVDTIL